MNGEWHQFNQISLGAVRVLRRYGERLSLLDQCLSEVFESTGNHQSRVLQVEALRHCTGEILSGRIGGGIPAVS